VLIYIKLSLAKQFIAVATFDFRTNFLLRICI